jgi:hypothetical protein
VYFQVPILITIVLIIIIIPSSMILITTNNYFGTTTNFAYGQTNQTIFNNANLLNIKNIPVKKVHVGDIDIAYKTLGKGRPFLFISGAGGNMDAWEPSTLKKSIHKSHGNCI